MRQRRSKGGKATTFFGGVAVLALANLFVKVFGFLYKVPLNRILGDEMANVNAAYSVYTLLYMISTAGIPVAVSLLVSRSRAEGRPLTLSRVFSLSLGFLAALGALGSGAMLLFAGPIANGNSGGDSYLCLVAIAPALFFVCLSSVFRGYFQGFGRMTPTAVSGIIEAFGKMLLGLLLVGAVLRLGGDRPLAAAYSVLAITLGIALGTLYLFVTYTRYRRMGILSVAGEESIAPKSTPLLRELARIAFPIALSAGVMSSASLLDAQMMRPLLFEYYGSAELAKAVFSDYSTGAVTLFNMPAVLVYPIASAIVPYITEARTRGDLSLAKRYATSSLRTASLISLPAALGMSVLSRPILAAVFVGDSDMAAHAGGALAILALSVFPLALLAVTNSLLQSFGRQGLPVLSMSAGLLVKIAVLFLLTPAVGPLAAPLGTLAFYLVAFLLNFFFVLRFALPGLSLASCLPAPTLSAGASALAAFLVFRLAAPIGGLALLPSIAAGGLVYLLLLFPLGGLDPSDLALLPHGDRLAAFLRSYAKRRAQRGR